MIDGMSEICIDCIHQEVCRYDCHCPSEHCNDRAIADDFRPQDNWKSYCEGQEVGFKKAEDVFERMKLIQETVDRIRNTFNLDMESDKLVRNCMALVQNAIDGEYHDMEEVDVSELERPEGKWIPVSKQLPDKYDSYLVLWRSLTEGYPDRLFYEICEYVPEEDEWGRIEQAGEEGAEIIAWMPLPEPYQEAAHE